MFTGIMIQSLEYYLLLEIVYICVISKRQGCRYLSFIGNMNVTFSQSIYSLCLLL